LSRPLFIRTAYPDTVWAVLVSEIAMKILIIIGLVDRPALVSATVFKAKAVQDEVGIINLCSSFTYEFLIYECL
jgi:hypothetical protein